MPNKISCRLEVTKNPKALSAYHVGENWDNGAESVKVSRQDQVELANEGELGLGPEPGVGGDKAVSPLTDDHPDVLHHVGVKPVGELLAHALVHRAVHLKQKIRD